MGLEPTTTPIMTADTLYKKPTLPSRIELEMYALEQRPEIQIASMKMKQYKDTISLEKARIWTDVDIGVSYKQDFDAPFRGWGPYVAFDIPIFDSNYAQIARARFLEKQAEKELRAAILHVKEELHTAYEKLDAIQKELVRYSEHIIPTHKKAIGWAFKYVETMQVNMLVAIQTRINLYEDTKKYIDTQYKLLHTFAELERAVGKQLKDSFSPENIDICSNEVKN
jgi:outer membrane protein TolC